MKQAWKLICFGLVVYSLMVAAVYLLQRELVFAPSSDRASPERAGAGSFAEVVLKNSNGDHLYSWYKKADPDRPTMLFLHGNGGSIALRAGTLETMADDGYGVFAVGYPGYGGSEGRPSEDGLVEAGKLAYQYLENDGVAHQQLVFFGVSLGTAVAVQLAAKNPSAAVVLLAPMSSVLEVASSQYPFLPVTYLLKDRFESTEFVGSISAPLLLIHGTQDALIPIDNSERLFARAVEPKVFRRLNDAGHNNLFSFGAMDIAREFINEHIGSN